MKHPNTLILVNGTPAMASLVAEEIGGIYYTDLDAALENCEAHPMEHWVVLTSPLNWQYAEIKECYPHAIATKVRPHDRAKRIAKWALTECLFR